MRRIQLPFAGILLCCLGCSLFRPSVTLTAVLPEAPEHWQRSFEAISYLLIYPDERGEICRQVINTAPGAGRREVEITLIKQNNLAVIARPLAWGGALVLPPAGALYPHDLDPEVPLGAERLLLTWSQGPAAEVVHRLRAAGLEVTGLNTMRLSREIETRGKGDPWRLDLEAIVQCLSEGSFRVTDIHSLPSRQVSLAPGPGEWFLESPFRRPRKIGDQEELALEAVTLGFHYLIDARSGCWYDLYLEQNTLCLLKHDGLP